MSHQKIASIIQRLSTVTAEQHDLWERTSEEGVFQASFLGYSVRLSINSDNYSEGQDYVLSIYDEDGVMVESVADTDLQGVLAQPYKMMQDLYESARRRTMGVEEALDTILDALGGPDPTPNEDVTAGEEAEETDGLPF